MAKKHFNELSPEEAELLALPMEEMGESVQIIGKILRHGLYSTNPTIDDGEGANNRDLLEMELGDVQAAQDLLARSGLVSKPSMPLDMPQRYDALGRGESAGYRN